MWVGKVEVGAKGEGGGGVEREVWGWGWGGVEGEEMGADRGEVGGWRKQERGEAGERTRKKSREWMR